MKRAIICRRGFAGILVIIGLASPMFFAVGQNPVPKSSPQALTPQQEQATFHVPSDFRVELVACEPNVIDPVAMAFDENGRLFVAEMRGYPNKGVGTGLVTSGRIRMLEDRDGDGFYEHSTIFAEGLRLPTSVMPWKGGILAAVSPDILYLKDTDGDGRADTQRKLYTGFGLANIQQMVNALQWGLDNWVYGCAGLNASSITSVERPDRPEVVLRTRGIRFHPEEPGSLEPISCGGQYGMAPNEWGQWFTNTNSQHLRHIVLPDEYLRRNPSLAVREVTIDIPDHDPACKVFRLSPFEGWREERTRRRREGPAPDRYPSTELVPGGYITSGCSPLIYAGGLFPAAYHGSSFICDPANNLIHRDILEARGATFVAHRGEAASEFLASTDNWFRPVNLCMGPDGAVYIADFYREVIETPISLPEDMKKKLNLESRNRGRIWKIVPRKSQSTRPPNLGKASGEDLVKYLEHPNLWLRLTAQRLLIERQEKAVVPALERLAEGSAFPPASAHALWTLHGLKSLPDQLIAKALNSREPGVREQALRLAEERLKDSEMLRAVVLPLVEDPSPRVRFQLAFSLGADNHSDRVTALAKLARDNSGDPWTTTAVLSSSSGIASSLLNSLAHDSTFTDSPTEGRLELMRNLATLIGVNAIKNELIEGLQLLGSDKNTRWQVAVLEGLGNGLKNSRSPLSSLWEHPPADLEKSLKKARPFFTRAAAAARDGHLSLGERTTAVRLLGFGPFPEAASALRELLVPTQASELQLAAARSLSLQTDPGVSEILLSFWNGYSPTVRREVVEVLFARMDRLQALLDAIKQKKVLVNQIEPSRLAQLRKHPDVTLRGKVAEVLGSQIDLDRRKVIEDFKEALTLKADATQGKAVFKKNCTTCHRLENEGVEVGPNLLSALGTKTRESLLVDILDPSREVDPRYLNYVVANKTGQVFTGIVVSETAASVTLRRAERQEDTILRGQIEEIQSTGKSVMPEGLEKQLSKQEVANLIAYLLSVAAPK